VILSRALTLPAAAALMAMPYFLIDGLFTRGEFLTTDARATAAALFQFGWGVPAFVLIRILSPGFFARGDTRTPMTFALVSVAVNAVLAFALFYGGMGVSGVAAAVSAAAWTNALLLGLQLWRTGHWKPGPRVTGRVARIALAALGLAGAVWAAQLGRPQIEAAVDAVLGGLTHGHGAKEIALILTTAAGGLAYVALAFATRAVTPAEVRKLIRRGR
ncbi:MAG: polysaccharide biosynthesis C-terminal domain-containing protein, partial [Alphaproteobacteria bacterium]|nr:polysaccharide biosynthesis C-terminal domain-containing protein [Alphaproteobacteria bacterium]